MKGRKFIFLQVLVLWALSSFSQTTSFEINPEKEKAFAPYMVPRHGSVEALAAFKLNNRLQYWKELWYYSESFYIKRNYYSEGATMNESMIAVDRFEQYRKADDEVIVPLVGFRDALVLLPANKLIYKP